MIARKLLIAVLLGGLLAPAAVAAPPRDDLAEKVKTAIDKGVRFLKDEEGGRGRWEAGIESVPMPGGWTALALLALLNAGVPAEDPVIQRGLKFLRTVEPTRTYVVGLQTIVFAQAGMAVDRERIQRNVDWLLKTKMENGWGYGQINEERGLADFSNTQYALLGLHEGIRAGARVPDASLREIQALYVRAQSRNPRDRNDLNNGGWGYRAERGVNDVPRMTMTVAGLCGLVITGMDLAAGQQKLRVDGSAENCGVYEVQQPTADALRWLSLRFPAQLRDQNVGILGPPFYCLYGIERAGRLTGQRFIGEHDWYRVGCEYLVSIQDGRDGHWEGRGTNITVDSPPIVATSFALLFLSKGRTPVLLTKFAYGPRDSEGWNNKHSDARHLVEFASKELFKNKPLAWQVFDVRRKEAAGAEQIRSLAAELLQSPIVYFNGHDLVGWRDQDSELLKEYVANGGSLLIENCCGAARFPSFDVKIREVLGKLFDSPPEPLAPDHAVFVGKYLISAKEFPLEGIQQGCKTVAIYSPVPLAGYWEANDTTSARGKKAFELGANIIAYTTGLEPPKPRLTGVEVFDPASERESIRRGFLKVAQLQHDGDWHPAPKAMRNLMVEARKSGLDVVLATRDLAPSDPNLFDYRFVYMHGRKAFQLSEAKEKKNLHFLLKSGGMMLADACCGSKAFDASFRQLMDELWAEEKLKLEPIPLTDDLFSKELNGTAITTVQCRREGADGRRAAVDYQDVAPALEGVKYNGRWVVIYSRYDLGCALEKHPSGDCLGHNYDSAVLLGKAAVLYALRR